MQTKIDTILKMGDNAGVPGKSETYVQMNRSSINGSADLLNNLPSSNSGDNTGQYFDMHSKIDMFPKVGGSTTTPGMDQTYVQMNGAVSN